MTRTEENSITLKEVSESVEALSSACDRLKNDIRTGEYLTSAVELTKIMILLDISKSLAVLADELKD